MKRLLTILFAFLSLQLAAQTQSSLPVGSVPYGNVYLDSSGNVWAGATGKTFKNIGLMADVIWLNDSIGNLRTSINGKADKSTVLDINGVAQDISTSRTWTIPTVTSLSALTDVTLNTLLNNQVLRYETATSKWKNWTPNFITLTSISAAYPILYDSGTGVISSQVSSTSQSGHLTSTDWNTFNNKAPIASPTFTGVPAAPTATGGTNTTQLATTAFVTSAVGAIGGPYLPLAGGTLTGGFSGTTGIFSGTVEAGFSASIIGVAGGGKVLYFKGGATNYNAMIALQQNYGSTLEITGSTTAGGSVYTKNVAQFNFQNLSTKLAGTLLVGSTGATTVGYSLDIIGNIRTTGVIVGNTTLNLYGDATGSNPLTIATNGTVTANNTFNGTSGVFSGNISASNLGTASGYNSTSINTALTIPLRDNNGDFAARIITAALVGNASTATALQTARTISGTSFDGSANITLNNTGITNGAGYITSASIPTVVSAFTNDSGYITSASIPTVVSAFTNDSGYITSAPLSGYLPLTGGTLTGVLTVKSVSLVDAWSGSSSYAYFGHKDFNTGTGYALLQSASGASILNSVGTLYLRTDGASRLDLSVASGVFSVPVSVSNYANIIGSDGGGKILYFSGGTTTYNAMIAVQQNYGSILEITATTAGGSSYTRNVAQFNLANLSTTLAGALAATTGTFSGAISASNLAWGNYSPTYTSGANTSGITGNYAHYTRVGDRVTVTGRCTLAAAAAGSSFLTISLPIASNLAVGNDLLGVATANTNSSNITLYAETTADGCTVDFTATTGTIMTIYYEFTYKII